MDFEVKNIDTKQSNKRNNQNSKDKTITRNKETQMTGQHEPLWKPKVKSGAPEDAMLSYEYLTMFS